MARDIQPEDLPRKFRAATQRALKAAALRLDSEFTSEISLEKWPWPNDTFRHDDPPDSPTGSPRDIVDYGQLRASQTRKQPDRSTFEWTWPVNYSAIVHEGGRFKSGTAYPARPWTKSAEKNVKPLEYFTDILERELDG